METAEGTLSRDARLVGRCTKCASELPLRLPGVHEQALDWECASCGESYRAVFLENWPVEFHKNVRRAGSQNEQGTPPAEPEQSVPVVAPRGAQRRPSIAVVLSEHQGVRCALETDLSRQFDAEISLGENLEIQRRGFPFVAGIQKHGNQPYGKRSVERCIELVRQSTEQLDQLYDALKASGPAKLQVVESISQDGLNRAAEDMDLFVCLGISPPADGYPSRHALRVAMLAMSVGANLGWDEHTLVDLGIGCLIHDVGMLSVRPETYRSKRVLVASDFVEIAKHPILSLELLHPYLDRTSVAAQMVAYQMHERCNGTGYPRGYRGSQIHHLAKIAAIADVFLALVSPRPHRAGMVPHHALKTILHGTARGLYDAGVVRALIKTVALFPIGSFVALSDGRVAKVIRAAGEQYDRPIVEAWDRNDPSAKSTVVNLSGNQGLSIIDTVGWQGQSELRPPTSI